VNADRTRIRLFILQVLVLALMATLFGRLWHLQVAGGDRYERAASQNRVREVVTPAVRGLLLDGIGRPLVRNRTQLVISVSRTELERQPDGGTAVLRRLSALLHRRYEDLRRQIQPCGKGITAPCWNGSPYQPVPIVHDAAVPTALQILERRDQFPGVSAEFVAAREYPSPEGANAAHLLGYLQPADEQEMKAQLARGMLDPRLQRADLVGRAGLEKQYDAALRGVPGVQRVAVDNRGRVTGIVDEAPPRPGNHIVTTIDAKVQAVAEQQLREAINRARTVPDFRGRRYRADSGAVVVLDVNTGAVVAMASYPTYDPSVWVGGISDDAYRKLTSEKAEIPLLSRAFQGGGPPGSTFKVVSTAAAGEYGYSLHAHYPCPSSFTVGNRSFKNFESQAYGAITLRRAIEVSCDTVFYRIAYSMWRRDGGNQPDERPKDPMQTMARAFGLGRPTGIDLPGEAPGRIADRAYKQRYWAATKTESCRRAETGYPELEETDPRRARFLERLARENCAEGYRFRAGDAVNFAIGQGDTIVTPLQLASVYAAIANGGTLWKPHVAKAELTPQGKVVRTMKPVRLGRLPVSERVLDYIQKALEGVSRNGTAAGVFRGFPLDEYTVGSKTGTAEAFGKQPSSWFASYAGKGSRPQYAIVMTVSQGGTGSGTSGPSVRRIYEAIFGIGQPAALPGGRPPSKLPAIRKDGTIQVVR
jgi:penicillin-binding protein 2